MYIMKFSFIRQRVAFLKQLLPVIAKRLFNVRLEDQLALIR